MRCMTVSNPSGRGCGKVILLGEHFVVHGAPALAAPLFGREVEGTLQRDASVIDAPGVPRGEVEAALALVCADLEQSVPGITVRTPLPIGAGLGSSAAFATALVRALSESRSVPLDSVTQARLVHLLESRVHGTPSGLDAAVVSRERLIRFERDVPVQEVSCGVDVHLVVADSGTPGATSEQVRRVQEFAGERPERFLALLAEASEEVDVGVAAVARGELALLGACMNDAHERLSECGVSTPALDGLVHAARAAGALGAKLTGAGGGGAIVALTPGPDTRMLEDALTKSGARHVMVTTLTGGEGT